MRKQHTGGGEHTDRVQSRFARERLGVVLWRKRMWCHVGVVAWSGRVPASRPRCEMLQFASLLLEGLPVRGVFGSLSGASHAKNGG